jgi:hypothetical protein
MVLSGLGLKTYLTWKGSPREERSTIQDRKENR